MTTGQELMKEKLLEDDLMTICRDMKITLTRIQIGIFQEYGTISADGMDFSIWVFLDELIKQVRKSGYAKRAVDPDVLQNARNEALKNCFTDAAGRIFQPASD